MHEVEREFLGIDHAEVSYKLMESWGLPTSLMNGVRLHHYCEEVLRDELQSGIHTLEAAMALANAVGDYFLSPARGMAWQRMQFLAQHYFHVCDQELESYLDQVRERIAQAADLFSVDMGDLGDPSDLMAQANQQLVALAMRAHVENTQIAAKQKLVEEERARLQSQNQELQEKVTRDSLTGVHNRAYFDDVLRNAMVYAQDRCHPCSVIFTDIDKFKLLNDNYGHQFGDEVLKRFAQVLARNLRASDVLARYGGEEFVVLVHRPTEKGLEKLSERLRQAVEAEVIEHQGQRVPVTSSFGAAILFPGRTPQQQSEYLLQQADAAMYDSKHAGRNRVTIRCLFSEEEKELLRAINQVKFSRWLVNQEILDIPTVSRLLLQIPADSRPIGEIAVSSGLISVEANQAILQAQGQPRQQPYGEVGIDQGLLTRDQLVHLISWQNEPPQKLSETLAASGLFSQERSQQLLERYLEHCPVTGSATMSMN